MESLAERLEKHDRNLAVAWGKLREGFDTEPHVTLEDLMDLRFDFYKRVEKVRKDQENATFGKKVKDVLFSPIGEVFSGETKEDKMRKEYNAEILQKTKYFTHENLDMAKCFADLSTKHIVENLTPYFDAMELYASGGYVKMAHPQYDYDTQKKAWGSYQVLHGQFHAEYNDKIKAVEELMRWHVWQMEQNPELKNFLEQFVGKIKTDNLISPAVVNPKAVHLSDDYMPDFVRIGKTVDDKTRAEYEHLRARLVPLAVFVFNNTCHEYRIQQNRAEEIAKALENGDEIKLKETKKADAKKDDETPHKVSISQTFKRILEPVDLRR
jgi:hypothetical protein